MTTLRGVARWAVVAVSLVSVGCSQAATDAPSAAVEDDAVAEPAALGAAACDRSSLITQRCSSLAFHVEWNAPAGPRRTMTARALRWLDLGVPFSKVDVTDGYRQDGAGAVSMAWELGASPTAAGFAPFGHATSFELGSLDELQPGDALNRVAPRGHIVLFAQWRDEAHQSLLVLEQAAPGRLMQLRAMSRPDASRYVPIRKNGL